MSEHVTAKKDSVVSWNTPSGSYLPGHCDQVAKPLVSQLVCNDHCHSLLGTRRCMVAIIHECCLPVGDESPVLHGTSTKVWDSYQVCEHKHSMRVGRNGVATSSVIRERLFPVSMKGW